MIRVSVWLACIPLTESVEEYFYYLSFHLLKKHLFISTYSIYSVNERYLNYKNESVISYVILKTYLVDRKRRKVKSKFQLSLHIRAPNPTRISWVQFSRSVVSDSLRPHGPQHVKPLCPSQTPRVHSNSCPSSQWYHPTISSSVIPFSSRLQPFPASGSFQMSQFFASGGQSTGVSASAAVLPMNIQDWFPLGWTGLISLQSKGLSRVFNTTVQKHQFFSAQLSLWSNSHMHTWLLEKP